MTDRDVREILEQLSDLHVMVARLEERVASVPQLETRVSDLERSHSKAVGWAAGAGAISGLIAALMLALLK